MDGGEKVSANQNNESGIGGNVLSIVHTCPNQKSRLVLGMSDQSNEGVKIKAMKVVEKFNSVFSLI